MELDLVLAQQAMTAAPDGCCLTGRSAACTWLLCLCLQLCNLPMTTVPLCLMKLFVEEGARYLQQMAKVRTSELLAQTKVSNDCSMVVSPQQPL